MIPARFTTLAMIIDTHNISLYLTERQAPVRNRNDRYIWRETAQRAHFGYITNNSEQFSSGLET